MTPREISRAADGIFGALLPTSWAKRSQQDQEDFGIDYEFELTPNDVPSGFIFKVQQKGAEGLEYTFKGKVISYSGLETHKARYYLKQLAIPVVLVVVDVVVKRVFWLVLQGNAEVEQAYADAASKKQSSLTLHIPIDNDFAKTSPNVIEEVAKCEQWLVVRAVTALSSRTFLEAACKATDPAKVRQAIGRHDDVLRIEHIESLFRSGRIEEVLDVAGKIFSSASESAEVRFAAAMYLDKVNGTAAHSSNSPTAFEQYNRWRYALFATLLKIMRPLGTPIHLRIFARYMFRTVRVRIQSEHDLALYLSSRVQEATGDPLTRSMTKAGRYQTVRRLNREFRSAQLDLARMIGRQAFHFIPLAFAYLLQSSSAFLSRLHAEKALGRDELVAWFDGLAQIAISTAAQLSHWHDIVLVALSQMSLCKADSLEDVQHRIVAAREVIEKIPDLSIRSEGLESVDEWEKHVADSSVTPPPEAELRMYRQMAAALGINLDDPNDMIAQVVNIGLDDLNPERVLRDCEHLFISPGPSGIPAQMLGLVTAGSKWVHCTKFQQSHMGLSLDVVYAGFRVSHCDECSHRVPRSKDWRWSKDWQMAEHERHKDIAKSADEALSGPISPPGNGKGQK